MKRRLLFFLGIGMLVFCPYRGSSQKIGVKTNLLYWATTTPNGAFELSWWDDKSIHIAGGYNGFKFSESKKFKHWMVQPEFRWWTCEAFNGHFFGAHAHYSYFNIGGVKAPFGMFPTLKDHRYQGRLGGAGVTYGYQWMLGKRWNLEAAIGLGYAYIKYDKYECPRCGEWLKSGTKHYFGPTKLAISFVYMIKYK